MTYVALFELKLGTDFCRSFMKATVKQISTTPIVFESLGLALLFMAYLLAGGQNRAIPTPVFSPLFVLAVFGIVLCCWALLLRGKEILERKQGAKRVFFDGVDAIIVSPFMLLAGARVLKVEGSFCLMFGCGIEIPPDIFNTSSFILFLLAIGTGSFGFISMFLDSKA